MATKKTTSKVAPEKPAATKPAAKPAAKAATKAAAKPAAKAATKPAATAPKPAPKPAITAPTAVKITTRKPAAGGAGVVFKSPGFRLTVLNELLDLGHFADGFEEAQADAEKVADYETDPRVRRFLDGIALTEELLAQVEKIAPDGGDEIYAGLVPVWDGEDDRFDIDSLDDVRLLPNLKRVSLYAMVKEGIDLAPLRELPELEVVNIALGGERAVKSWSVLDELAALGVEVTRD